MKVLDIRSIDNENLGKYDVSVITTGSSDVAKIEYKEMFTYLVTKLENTSRTNVVLVHLPNRFDLVDWSCVNKD